MLPFNLDEHAVSVFPIIKLKNAETAFATKWNFILIKPKNELLTYYLSVCLFVVVAVLILGVSKKYGVAN